jgi:crotonobetainyl-CoA:carnitine CoA-transferase CaiB-like acyl-CoA transferase
MGQQLTLSPDFSHEHQLVLLPKDRKSGAQLPMRRSQRIKNATAADEEHTAAPEPYEENREAMERKESGEKWAQRYQKWKDYRKERNLDHMSSSLAMSYYSGIPLPGKQDQSADEGTKAYMRALGRFCDAVLESIQFSKDHAESIREEENR